MNVVQILSVGLSGLALLLMILAYRLLNNVVANPNPTISAISLVKFYLGMTVAVLVIVGLFSLPLIGKNQSLTTEKEVLSTNIKELAKDTTKLQVDKKVLTAINGVNEHLDTISKSTSAAEVKEQLNKIKGITDQLPKTTETSDPAVQNVVVNLKKNIDNQIRTSTKPVEDKDTMAFVRQSKSKLLVFKKMNAALFKQIK